MVHLINNLANANKAEKYRYAITSAKALCQDESNKIANMANIAALLKEVFNWWWVGFYWVDSENELVLGPFQGPIACTRIHKAQGVCGACWRKQATVVVPNVHEFDGHIACSSATNSEIVVPIFKNSEMVGLLDVDSELLAHFDQEDALYLEKFITEITAFIA